MAKVNCLIISDACFADKILQKNIVKNISKVLQVLKNVLPLHSLNETHAEIAQLVEHNLAKVGVASSSLVFRSLKF